MKGLKIKSVSAALLLMLFAVNASAQPQQPRKGGNKGGERPTAEKIAEIATDKLDQKLELSDSQETKIYAINLKYAKLREENKPERPAKMAEGEKPERPNQEEMKAKRDAAEAQKKAQMLEIMKLLSDEQKVEYALMQGENKAKRGGRPQQGKGQQGQGQQGRNPQGGRPECPPPAPEQAQE